MAQSPPHNLDTRRRDKPVLSCSFCRGRKLRCDRQSPCSACLRRGKPAECVYTSSEQERRDAIDYRPRTRNQQVRQRVARLESLVVEMREMARSPHQPSSHPSSPSHAGAEPASASSSVDGHLLEGMGSLSLTDEHAVYTGSSHWATILEDIEQLKHELSEDTTDGIPYLESDNLDARLMRGSPATRVSLLSSGPSLPHEQILARVPPRKVVDRYVSHFFNTFDMGPIVLHRDTFLAEYTRFWDNPSGAPIMWVGLLYSVITMSVFHQQQDVEAIHLSGRGSYDLLNTYRALTIQCLIAGNYLQPGRYTIETLTLHFAIDQNMNLDTSIGNWVLIGVVIRIALRMGLHRDPSHWANIRPLQAEFRRRLWMTLYQMDFFTSTQVGLPRIIKDSQCDTYSPGHFFDNDLVPEHDELPLERNLTEPTPLLYIIQRHAIIKIAAEIYDATEAGPPSPAVSIGLGTKLQRAVDTIPAWLKYKSVETSIADTPILVLNQMVLDILIHKAVYLLHRRSFVGNIIEKVNPKSNELCIKAALSILAHQRRMNEEIQPGGLMSGIRWKVATSLNHEFLQATMMLSFALSKMIERDATFADDYALTKRDDIVDALTLAKALWEQTADQSVEARKAAAAIKTVLQQGSEEINTTNTPKLSVSDGFKFFDPLLGEASQDYLNNLDYYGHSTILYPSFLLDDAEMTGVGSITDDFGAGPSNT